MELYNTCARLIERGKTNGMQRKLDIFFANDRLTEEEYEKLCTQLAEKLKEQRKSRRRDDPCSFHQERAALRRSVL